MGNGMHQPVAGQPCVQQDDMEEVQRNVAELMFRVAAVERAQGQLGQDLKEGLADVCTKLDDMAREFRASLGRHVPVWTVPLVGVLTTIIGVVSGALFAVLQLR